MRGQFLLVLPLLSGVTMGQTDPPPAMPRGPAELSPFDRFQGFAEALGDMNWAEEGERLRKAAALVWQRNGWTDEADLFARDVACDVAAIPPWEVTARLRLLTSRVAEHYGLNADQATELQGAMFREAGTFLAKNSKTVLEFGGEVLSGRARGEPFTAEQVKRWAQALQPLLADAEQSAERLSRQVEPWLDAEHKQRLEQDFNSFQKRSRFMREMQARWAAGQWSPADWGMENDPIQTGALKPAAMPQAPAPPPAGPAAPVATREPAAIVIPTHWVAHDPTTWIAYVLDFEGRFGLDAGQTNSARSIHRELFDRAADYAQAHRAELEPVAAAERAEHEAYEPIRSLFAELQQRLDSLPRTDQRGSKGP